MKIFRLICFLLVVVVAYAYSADCVAYGYGHTEEEARSEAYRNLVASILGENIASTRESSVTYNTEDFVAKRYYSRNSMNTISSSAISGIVYSYGEGGHLNAQQYFQTSIGMNM